MTLVQQTAIQLITAFIAFVLGFLLSRFKAAWAYFNARKFWRPLLRRDLTLVLGDGFADLRGFEASDVVGRGDLVGSYVLTTRFAGMGFRRLQPVFADKMIGDDPSGTGLRKNLVVLGGRDANTLTGACLSRLNCTYTLEWLAPPEDSQPTSSSGRRHLPELQPTVYAPEELKPFHPVESNGRLVKDYGVIVRARNPFMPPGARDKHVVLIYEEIRDAHEDIECVVVCDVLKDTPQSYRCVYLAKHPAGTLSPDRSSVRDVMRSDVAGDATRGAGN
jgi:hypothetical protein